MMLVKTRRLRVVVGAAALAVVAAGLTMPAADDAEAASAAGAADATLSAEEAGIPILPDLPEPVQAQFAVGRTNVVEPTAAPATDMARISSERAAGQYQCPGFGAIDDATPLANVYRDVFTWGNFAPYRVGNGKGNINWRANPYGNPSWYMWFHSLRWLGQGVIAASLGDRQAMDRVGTVIKDWVADNPYSWHTDIGAYEATRHRTNVIICYRQAVLSGLGATSLPSSYSWIDRYLREHAKFLTQHWSGAWNHGTEESLALFGVGCTVNRTDYKQIAQDRLAAGITTSIDSQGSTNEQSTSYAHFNYALWGRVVDVLKACGGNPGSTIQKRRDLMAVWLATATNSLGSYHQIGDSERSKPYPYAGTPMEYAATLGESGPRPPRRVGVYNAGYIFGRTGWGQTRPFTGEASYSIRFGPARAVHGHSDHLGLTYTARGRDILIDGGHAGYQNDAWRVWARSPYAHGTLSVPTAIDLAAPTRLNRQALEPMSDFFEFSDSPAVGVQRTRGVLVLRDPDLIVTLDQGSSSKAQQFKTLWNLPSDQTATIYSRSTVIASKPGDNTKTILFQIPYRGTLPAGAALVKRGQTNPIQGWHYPTIFSRKAAPTVQFVRSGTSAYVLSFVVPIRTSGSVTYTTGWSGSTFVVNLNVGGVRTSIGITAGGSLVRRS
jgi:hypothetical protein